ncbi:hypothetical protein [Paenibacillus xylanexedens]|uniref:hypothetical protein n=1 Tax=Paenibacillus xylanexedens TaxID=528191 RepID=UPI0011A20FE1|nr:hypothetical protein [Paenibacillus xylanexedens]
MNKTLLVKSAYLVELTEEEFLNKYDEIMLSISNVIGRDISVSSNKLQWESISTILLDPETINCGRCNNCKSWVTDREKENHIDELNNGAIINGKILCDECLPEGHPWAF